MPRHPHEPVTPTLPFPPMPPAPPCGCTPPRMRPEPFSPGGLPAPHGFDFGRWAREKIGWLLSLVPSEADADNQLADKAWVEQQTGELGNGKADKVDGATAGNLAALDSEGNLADSGAKPDDFATAAQGAKADTAVQPEGIAGFVDGAEYDAEYGAPPKPTILLKHGSEVVATVDATDFVIDGMVSDVKIVGGNLVITFNTDAGQEPISIPLTDIFDPDNYYDKTAADGKFVAKEAGKGLSTEDYTTAEKTKLGGIAAGAQVNVIETVKVNGTALTPQDKAVNIPVPTLDNTVTPTSANGVKSSGIWSALWGALSALPTGFSSLYDWCVAQLAGKLDTSSAAPAFTAKTYAANDLCTYNGVVYRCKVGYTATASSAKPDADTTHWEARPVSELFLPLAGGAMTGQLQVFNLLSAIRNVDTAGAVSGAKFILRGTTNEHYIQFAYQDDKYGLFVKNGPFDAGTFYPMDNIAAVPNKADISAIPYNLGTPIVIDTASSETVEGETVYYGAATLADRTANVVQVTAATALDELRITFPAATSGKVRDFGLRVEIGTGSAALAAPALVPTAPTGETIKLENADGTIPALADGTATAKGVTLLYFSETAPGVFVVKGEQVEEVA